jgi:hypothetical protein
LVESFFADVWREVVEHDALGRSQVLHHLPIRVIFLVIFLIFLVLLVWIGAMAAGNILSTIEAIAIETGLAVVSVLIIAFFVILWLAVVRTAVEPGPFFAADVTKAVATFASA